LIPAGEVVAYALIRHAEMKVSLPPACNAFAADTLVAKANGDEHANIERDAGGGLRRP